MRCIAIVALILGLAAPAYTGSDTPPKGPPWERDLLVAQQKALQKNLPIFLYFTKTY
jgi:hypothetical protein